MKSPKLVVVSTRITETFSKVVEEYMSFSHVSTADLLRDALREKMLREAPNLIEKHRGGERPGAKSN